MVVADILRCLGGFELAGFIDDSSPERWGRPYFGSTILGGQEQFPSLLATGVSNLIVGIGDCAARMKLAATAKARGFQLASAIHPRSTIARDVPVGEGTAILAGSVINAAASVGANAIINSCASVDHECVIEDGVHLSPGVRLGGKVRICRGAWLALNVAVAPGVTIGAGTIVGAGSIVLSDLPPNVLAFGAPAKAQRELSPAKA